MAFVAAVDAAGVPVRAGLAAAVTAMLAAGVPVRLRLFSAAVARVFATHVPVGARLFLTGYIASMRAAGVAVLAALRTASAWPIFTLKEGALITVVIHRSDPIAARRAPIA